MQNGLSYIAQTQNIGQAGASKSARPEVIQDLADFLTVPLADTRSNR